MNKKMVLGAILSLFLILGCKKYKSIFQTPVPEGKSIIAFQNVNLVPMTENKTVQNQTVVIKEGRIVAIGPQNTIPVPKNSKIIDGTGNYLMPGLADMHMHTRHDWQNENWPVSPLSLYLANGITTIRDFGPEGTPADHGLHWRKAIEKGYLAGPSIYTCGKIIYGPVADPVKEVESQKAKGFDFIKLYSFLTSENYNKGMAAVKRHNMYSAGHIPFQVGLDGILSAGMNEIAHIEELLWELVDFDPQKELMGYSWLPYVIGVAYQQFQEYQEHDIDKFNTLYKKRISEIVDKLRVSNTPVCTTLALDEVIVQKLHHPGTFTKRKENKYLTNGYLDTFYQGKEKHQLQFKGGEPFAHLKFHCDKLLLLGLKKAGVPLVLATDAGTSRMGLVPGFSIHDELRVLTENGFSPYEAIVTGTINASRVIEKMNGNNEFGSIEVGKRADLILLEKNPLQAIDNIKNPLGVMAYGRWYDKNRLKKMICDQIPITGEIRHVYHPDTGSKTQIEIIVGNEFSGRLPDDIINIEVTGPNGKLPINKSDFKYFPGIKDFFIEIPGTPDIGTYTFIVYSKNKIGLGTDTQSENIKIPRAVMKKKASKDGDAPVSVSPTLSWEPVNMQIPVYYRVIIMDKNKNRIHHCFVNDRLSYIVPEGVLKPGQIYFWNIRTSDSDQWVQEQNRSLSRMWKFKTRSG